MLRLGESCVNNKDVKRRRRRRKKMRNKRMNKKYSDIVSANADQVFMPLLTSRVAFSENHVT